MKNVAVISLGCDKNRVDTERMLYRISQGGFCICDVPDADVVVINTCAFIESARQESIDAIISCAELKKTGKPKRLIVTGCLPQKYKDELIAELPEVDAFLGAFEYDRIVAAINGEDECACTQDAARDFCAEENVPRLLTTYPHTAYLKIAEGCDNHCTFCTIPSIRGRYRSRPIADIVAEAKRLVDDGVKELILVAQDVTRFGEDRGKNELIELLKQLAKLPLGAKPLNNASNVGGGENGGGEFGIKLLYCYPERVTDELIDLLAPDEGKVFSPYIDIPIQHCSDRLLKLMNRHTTKSQIEQLIFKLHERGITVRTTLMVGFPGETEDDFNELIEFVKRVRPDYTGIFAYSREDGTPAAKLKNQVSAAEKRRRVKELGRVCAEIMFENNKKIADGSVRPVLYEDIDFDRNMFVGRLCDQAPEVDGRVYFTARTPLEVGNIYAVAIDGCDEYDLFGHIEPDEVEDEFTE